MIRRDRRGTGCDTGRDMHAVPRISSSDNPRFRETRALQRASDRRRAGRILVDGVREIGRALDAGVRPVEAWIDPERLDDEGSALRRRLESAGCAVVEADGRLIDRLSYGDRQTGLVLVAQAPDVSLDRLRITEESLIAVVECVEKPGNLGAILRSADGAGVEAVIVADPSVDPWNPNVIRASLGTVFTVPLAVDTTDDTIAWLRRHGIRMVAARVDAATDYTDADLTGSLAVILGSEAHGLSEVWTGPDLTAVRVPMHGVADSLNVSVTAAILFYEALRQRGPGSL